MMQFKKYIYLIIAMLLLQVAYGCDIKPKPVNITATDKPVADSAATTLKTNLNDEQLFRQFLDHFKGAVKAKNKAQITAMFSFPLQTTPQWANDDLKNSTIDPKRGLINEKEFAAYFDDIFTNDAIKLIPASAENDLSEIDKTTTENYYKTLTPITDNGSTLYELQKQYPQDNGQETSFGFVFGKVKGAYKVISYYRPWPLKD